VKLQVYKLGNYLFTYVYKGVSNLCTRPFLAVLATSSSTYKVLYRKSMNIFSGAYTIYCDCILLYFTDGMWKKLRCHFITAKTALIKHKTSSHSVEIPDHGYYCSTYSIPPTTKPTNIKTFGKHSCDLVTV